jgi:hypothetical protein
VDPVAAGLAADVDHGVADAGRLREEHAVRFDDAEVERVDEDVAAVALVEGGLAADRRDADRVAVAADAVDHAAQQVLVQRIVERTEAQRVERGDRPRAHREHVAQDPADARRGALARLDERRVVVALDLEHDCEPVADRDDTRVLAGPLEHLRSRGGQPLQVLLRRLVRAVLRPHHREDPELGVARRAAEDLLDLCVLRVGQPVIAREREVDLRLHELLLHRALRQ